MAPAPYLDPGANGQRNSITQALLGIANPPPQTPMPQMPPPQQQMQMPQQPPPVRPATLASPAVGPDERLFVASWDHHLYCIQEVSERDSASSAT